MQLLFDVNIVIDICAERVPHFQNALRIQQWCLDNHLSPRLYTGSVQTLQYTLAAALLDHDRLSGRLLESKGTYLKRSAALLDRYTKQLSWLSALSEDGDVWDSDDPEDEQLLRAVGRLADDALLLTRDAALLDRSEKAISPEQFISRFIEPAAGSEAISAADPMPFCDLSAQLDTFRPAMEKEILSVVESTAYIKGPAVGKFEGELAGFLGGGVEAIGCANGTDALMIALMALDVRPGDEVIIPDFTFIATGEMVSLLGAVPVFCDVDPVSFNLDAERIEACITDRTVGIIPVSIFGQCADFDALNAVAESHGLWVMEDGAQSFGAEYKGRKSCTLTPVATTSFFPAKPLGCYGDGGAIFTSDPDLAKRIRIILNHGQSKRYHHSVIGVNGRLDTLQAAILSVKLKTFSEEIVLRQEVASRYTCALETLPAVKAGALKLPRVLNGNSSVWAQYTVRHSERDRLREALSEAGIPTAVHYPVPLHRQEAFGYLKPKPDCPVTEEISREVFSLPMHPFLHQEEIERVAGVLGRIL